MRQTIQSKFNQSGQGLVEYAILLLLTITLVIGGIELASTALASNKAQEAADSGINEYVIVNEQRLKIQANISRYLERLDRLDLSNSDIVDLLDARVKNVGGYLWDGYQSGASGETFSHNGTHFEIYIDGALVGSFSVGGNYAQLQDLVRLIDGVLDDNEDGIIDDADRDDDISTEELYYALKFNESLLIDDSNVVNEDGINDVAFDIIRSIKELDPASDSAGNASLENDYRKAKLQALILFEHIQLSLLPLDPRIALSESVPLLADHDVGLMEKPNCDTSDPDNILYYHGFPGEELDVDGDGIDFDGIPHMAVNGIDYPAVYLFNPLPIDSASCPGSDANRGGSSLVSILVGGYGQEGKLDDIEYYTRGLPKLNQAFYSQYQQICLNGSDEYVSCGDDSVAEEYLKPPGKLCLTSSVSDSIDSCPDIDSVNPDYAFQHVTGYYFWGNGGSSSNGDRFEWVYGVSGVPPFRPTFQLLCNGESTQSEEVVGENCISIMDSDNDGDIDDNDQLMNRIYQVEVNVRYRSVFESFLAFGMHELQDDAELGLKYYFFDPANLRALANNDISGSIVGSELGPKQGDLPTVKPFKDFRGCYEVNVDTNQVSACN